MKAKELRILFQICDKTRIQELNKEFSIVTKKKNKTKDTILKDILDKRLSSISREMLAIERELQQ